MPDTDEREIRRRFNEAVNMSPAELEKWLKTPESEAVGWKGGDGKARESVGHASGRRIVEIQHKRNEQLTNSDYAHMRKVIGFVRRHSAQRPANIYTSRWRYSLMNWGHDPTKAEPTAATPIRSRTARPGNSCQRHGRAARSGHGEVDA